MTERKSSVISGKSQKASVLIGPVADESEEPISVVIEAIATGLRGDFDFVLHMAPRAAGETRHARLNPVNVYYLVRHFWTWVSQLFVYRPTVAHYAVTSFWNLEKSLLFLKVARFTGAKTVGHLHGGGFREFWQGIDGQRKKRAQKELKRLDALVVLGARWKEFVQKECGITPARVHVVPNLIRQDFEEFALQLPIPRKARGILFLSLLTRRKGMFDLLDACHGVLPASGFTLYLVGPEREPGIAGRCRERIVESGLSGCVRFIQGAWGEEKKNLFKLASIFVLPSYRENFPLAIIEAAAAGLAIVATPVGANPEYFEHGKSIVFVEPGNVMQLQQALLGLMRDERSRSVLGEAARQVFRTHLAREGRLASMHAVYDSVVGAAGGHEIRS